MSDKKMSAQDKARMARLMHIQRSVGEALRRELPRDVGFVVSIVDATAPMHTAYATNMHLEDAEILLEGTAKGLREAAAQIAAAKDRKSVN